MTGKLAAIRVGVVAVALGVVLSGCTGGVQPAGTGSSSGAIWPTHESVSPSPTTTGTPELTDDQLYQLAVSQYRKLFAAITDVEQNGGAPQLPDLMGQYLIDPAWSAIDEFFSIMYERGDHYTNTLDYRLTAVAPWQSDQVPDGAVTAVQTCELSQGAALLSSSGEVIHDGSPVIMHRRVYFKYDPADDQLKVFILNGEAVESCPIE